MWWIALIIVPAVIVIAGVFCLFLCKAAFKRNTGREAAGLFRQAVDFPSGVLTEEDIASLPKPVQRYLRYTRAVGRERVTTVRLKQQGVFRLQGKPWMRFEAEQYYTTNPPAFCWTASMKAFPLLSIHGRDLYASGAGNMLIKIPPFVTIADARGHEINQGSLVRYLNEMMWFPSSYLEEYIAWEEVDTNSARATMNYNGISAAAMLHFNDEGRMTNFVAGRYFTNNDGYSLEQWSTPLSQYAEINGMYLPVKGEGVWNLADGDFAYIRLEITRLEYNKPEPFQVP